MSFNPGDRIIIHRDPRQIDTLDVGMLGEVIHPYTGRAMGGGEVALVRYEDPVDWRDYQMTMTVDRLAPATADRLHAMANRYERLAEGLRSLARAAR